MQHNHNKSRQVLVYQLWLTELVKKMSVHIHKLNSYRLNPQESTVPEGVDFDIHIQTMNIEAPKVSAPEDFNYDMQMLDVEIWFRSMTARMQHLSKTIENQGA